MRNRQHPGNPSQYVFPRLRRDRWYPGYSCFHHLFSATYNGGAAITGLTNYVSYTCSVHATNSVGSSSESATAVKVVKRSAGITPLLGIIND